MPEKHFDVPTITDYLQWLSPQKPLKEICVYFDFTMSASKTLVYIKDVELGELLLTWNSSNKGWSINTNHPFAKFYIDDDEFCTKVIPLLVDRAVQFYKARTHFNGVSAQS